MDNLEKVEKLREKTGVSYEEAKAALEATNYDVLDAIIYLEKNGKVFFLVWKTFKEKRGFQVHHRKTRQHYGECTCSGIDTCDRLRILDYDSIISGRFIL